MFLSFQLKGASGIGDKWRLKRNTFDEITFKAGLHFGKVISAQIGDLKREIVYNGDVLNTASRIQNECNKYQRDCLVSGSLMNKLKEMNGF